MRHLLLALAVGCGAPEVPPAEGPVPTFSADIEPLLEERCLSCHAAPTLSNAGLGYVVPTLDGDEPQWANGPVDLQIARSTALRAVCTAISPAMIDAYSESLTSVAFSRPAVWEDSEFFEADLKTCAHWKPLSMPPGAGRKLTPEEQLMFVRWLEGGMPE